MLDNKVKTCVEHEFLQATIEKFKEISGLVVKLNFIDNWRPFSKGFFAELKNNNQQIGIDMLGSGYEMVFALIYSFFLTKQSGKQLIAFIDEPELHLHPSLQSDFVKFLLEISKESQVILTSHSPLLIKQLTYNENVSICILQKSRDELELVEMDERLLPYVSANEINFLAFDLPTEEYHNELYEELKYLKGDDKAIKDFDKEFFQADKGEPPHYPWKNHPNEVSLHTFIRNQIHHQKDNGKAEVDNVRISILKMREFLQEIGHVQAL
jgi:ABC-type multidrug transport system ATPase subunit